MKKAFILFLTFCCAISKAGTFTHGGDSVVAEFVAILDKMDPYASEVRFFEDDIGFDFESGYRDLRTKLVVKSQEEIFLNAREVEAINFYDEGKPTIILSRKFWNYSTESHLRYLRLAMHEILPLMGRVDSDYKGSAKYTDILMTLQNPKLDLSLLNKAFESLRHTIGISKVLTDRERRGQALTAVNPTTLILKIVQFAERDVMSIAWQNHLKKLGETVLRNTSKDMLSDSEASCAVKTLIDSSLFWHQESIYFYDLYERNRSPHCGVPSHYPLKS